MMEVATANKENVPPAVNFHGVIHVNGYKYHKKCVCKKYTIYWCCNRRNLNCSVTVHMKMDGNIEVVGEHSERCKMRVKGAKRILKEIKEGGDPEFKNKKKVGEFT